LTAVPKGQISANTLEFLGHLMYDEYNDRGWFKSHEPWFRKAEQVGAKQLGCLEGIYSCSWCRPRLY